MKVAISGVTGFLGGELDRAFRALGHEVIGFARAPRAGHLRGELGQALVAGSLEGLDLFVHAAWDLRSGSHERNRAGTLAWYEQAKAAGTRRQIFLTSISATRDSPSEYGRSKFATEAFFLARGEVVLRPGLVIGPGGLFERISRSSRRWPFFPALGGRGISIRLTGLSDLIRLVVEPPSPRTPAWNAFAPQTVTMAELIRRVRGPGVIPIPVPLARAMLALSSVFLPRARPMRDSFRALEQSQRLELASDWLALGMKDLTLESMLSRRKPPPRPARAAPRTRRARR